MILQYQNQPTPLVILLELHLCCHTVANHFKSAGIANDACSLKKRRVLTAIMKDNHS